MQSPQATSGHKEVQVTGGLQPEPLGCALLLFFSASPKIKHALKGAWGCNGEGMSFWELFASLLPLLEH